MKDCYILDKNKGELARDDMFVLHPLPRVNEFPLRWTSDPRYPLQAGIDTAYTSM